MIRTHRKWGATLILLASMAIGCASVLKHKDADVIQHNEEYEKAITIKELPDTTGPGLYVRLPGVPPTEPVPVEVRKKKTKPLLKKVGRTPPDRRQPDIEDREGFVGASRRPVVDPFRVGEKVTMEVTYFGMAAGDITFAVLPFVEVNSRKAYHFKMTAKSISVFAMIYTVDDWAQTFVDYNEMIPFNYSLHVKESKQLREVRSVFDWNKQEAFVWDKKVTKDREPEEKRYEWKVLPYSQNVFSIGYYVRLFHLVPGKKLAIRLGHEGKNLLVTIDVLRREVLSTPLGDLKTVVVKPTVEIDGVFKPVGDILFWLTDDDRKFLVRTESKIRIGTIVGRVKSIEKGME